MELFSKIPLISFYALTSAALGPGSRCSGSTFPILMVALLRTTANETFLLGLSRWDVYDARARRSIWWQLLVHILLALPASASGPDCFRVSTWPVITLFASSANSLGYLLCRYILHAGLGFAGILCMTLYSEMDFGQ